MALIIVEKGSSEDLGKRFPMTEKAMLIGRVATGNSPDIALHDEYVSRRHAEITVDGNHFVLRDLNSTNGTTLDGLSVEPGKSYQLKNDSLIGLGAALGVEARAILRFKESPTVSTARMIAIAGGTGVVTWLRIDNEKGEVWVDGKLVSVSKKEYDLLLCLRGKAGKVCDRDELIAGVWPDAVNSAGVSDAAIDQLVHRLRLKIEPDPVQPKRLTSKKGFGYTLIL